MRAINIEWNKETKNGNIRLPKHITIPPRLGEEEVHDWLENKYGCKLISYELD